MSTHLDRRPTGDDDLENALRGAFRHGADLMPATTDPWSRTTRAVHRSQVRRRTGAVAALAAAAVVGVVGLTTPWADGLRRAEPLPADRGGPVVTDLRQWPTRGDLRRDDAVVAAARKTLTDGGANVLSVPFAGTVGGARLVLALVVDASEAGDPAAVPIAVAMYPDREAAGGSAGDGINYDKLVDGRLTYATPTPDGGVDAVVLVSAGSSVAVSPKATYEADGTPRRDFRQVGTRDGVAVVHLDGTSPAQVSFRVVRDGRTTLSAPDVAPSVPIYGKVPDQAALGRLTADPRCGGAVTVDELTRMLPDVYALRGLDDRATSEMLWCRDGDLGTAAAVLVRPPDRSAAFVMAYETRRESDGAAEPDRLAGMPVPVDRADTWPVPVTSAVEDPSRMVVSAPGARTVEVAPAGGGAVLATAAVQAGGFTELRSTGGPIPDRVRLTTKDARGKVLVSYDVDRATARDDLATKVDGPVS